MPEPQGTNTAVTYDALLAAIKRCEFKPVYFLHGEEPWFIDALSDALEAAVLSDHERAFNQTILYGKDSDARAVTDAARRLPMMAAHSLVVLREAQEMRTLNELQPYIEKPTPTTVLVICYKHKKLDVRSKFGKAVQAHAVVFESKPLYDNQVGNWVTALVKTKKRKIQPEAADLMVEMLGTNLGRIATELDKIIRSSDDIEITTSMVSAAVSHNRAYNQYDLQNALAQRDLEKLGRIVSYFEANPKEVPLPVIIASLYGFFSKLLQLCFLGGRPDQELLTALELRSSYFLRLYKAAAGKFNRQQIENIIHILCEYDLRSKGIHNVSADYKALINELVWKISHA